MYKHRYFKLSFFSKALKNRINKQKISIQILIMTWNTLFIAMPSPYNRSKTVCHFDVFPNVLLQDIYKKYLLAKNETRLCLCRFKYTFCLSELKSFIASHNAMLFDFWCFCICALNMYDNVRGSRHNTGKACHVKKHTKVGNCWQSIQQRVYDEVRISHHHNHKHEQHY